MRKLCQILLLPSLLYAGVVVGLLVCVPNCVADGMLPDFLLIALVAQVGFGLGNNGDFIKQLRMAGLRTLLLPFFTILGTLAITSVVSLFVRDLSCCDVLAAGSGFGYYSLSSMLILDFKEASAGVDAAALLASISLLANVFRELIALSCCGMFARLGSVSATISLAGINSMDVCLPLIFPGEGGKPMMSAAIIHGIIFEVSVPILIYALCV